MTTSNSKDLTADLKGNKSVIKALEILDYLAETKEPIPLMEIAIALDLPQSTVHRLLASLLMKNYVRQVGFDNRYTLSWKFLTFANSLSIVGQLPQLLKFHLRNLAKEVSQAINLSFLVGKNVFYLDSINPTDKITLFTPYGTMVPAYASSMGKILLADLSNDEIEALFPEHPLQSYTNSTISTMEALIQEIDRVRTRGFAIDRGEYDENVHCVGAPVKDSCGILIAALSISVISNNLPSDWYLEYLPALFETCKKISCEL